MGIYYNRGLIDTVPTLWSNFADILKKPETEVAVPGPADNTLLTVSSPKTNTPLDQPAFTNLGYGAATPASPDILALLTVQKK